MAKSNPKTTTRPISFKVISQKQAHTILNLEASKGNLCFLTGAGISKIPPANLPLGYEIKDRLIELITTGKKVKKYRNKILAHPKYQAAIPELIFQPIYECVGPKIYSIFDLLKSDNYNHIHQKLGWYHKAKKTRLYTTNFDTLIEQASSFPVDVEHLHGSIDKPEEMIIRIYQVGRGIRKRTADRFKKENTSKVLVVLGYSGNDKDIMTLINNTSFKNILWLVRDLNDRRSQANLKKLTRHIPFVFVGDLSTMFRTRGKLIHHKPAGTLLKATSFTPITEIEAWKCLQAIYFTIENFNEALKICNYVLRSKSLKLDSKDQSWFRQVTADNLNRIGVDFKSAINHMKAAIRINIRHNNKLELAEAYSALGNIYNQKKRPDSRQSLFNLKEAEKVALGIDIKTLNKIERDQLYVLLGKVYNNMGLCYDHDKDYPNAIDSYKKSIRYKNKTGNITAIAITQANLALAYKSTDSGKHVHWAQEAEQVFIEYGLYFRLGYLYRELGGRSIGKDKQSAIEYLNKALHVYDNYMHDAKMDKYLTEKYLKHVARM